MLSINSNVASLNAQINLNRTSQALSKNFAHLSSGLRINDASDDAAGLAISTKMQAQISSLAQAQRNTNDGVSLLQTADGAMSQVGSILNRMRDLATESATGTVGSTDRSFLNSEFSTLNKEITRIAKVTSFNGINLLDGTATNVNFQVGTGATTNDRIAISLTNMQASQLGGTSSINAQNISTVTGAQNSLSVIDKAIDNVSSARSNVGSYENRLSSTVSNLQSAQLNLTSANSQIQNIDVASESAQMTQNNILQQAGVAVLAQANQAPSLALSLLK